LENKINETHEKVSKYTGLKSCEIPPIFALVLERSKNITDIPRAMVEVKYEFEDITRMQIEFNDQLNHASSLKCQIDIIEYYESLINKLTKKISNRKKSRQERFFDVLRPMSLNGALKTVADDLIFNAELKISLTRVNRYVELYEQVLESRPVRRNIERLFGDISVIKI